MERCPACRARLKGVAICGRCGCDLTIPMHIESKAKLLEQKAVAALSRGELAEARADLERARQLQASPMQQVLLRFTVVQPGTR